MKKDKRERKMTPQNYKVCCICGRGALSKRTAKPTTANKNTRERIMIKMLQLLGALTGGIIALLMGIWVSKKI